MIEGFEIQTAELTEEEKKLLPFFITGLNLRQGKDRAISSGAMAAGLKKKHNIDIDGPRIRKIINHIRNNFLTDGIVLASSRGYWVSTDPSEIQAWIKGMEERIGAQVAILKNAELRLIKILNNGEKSKA